MARKSGPRQLKRGPSPPSWAIHRKDRTWAPSPRPGAHQRQNSVPIVLLLRDVLGHARTSKEAEKIVNRSIVKVDGRVRRDHRFPVGLMDIVSIAGLGKSYRMLPRPRKGLSLVEIQEKESNYKICKIIGKNTTRGGQLQLALHDGRTVVVPRKESLQKTEEAYSVGGAVQIAVPAQKIVSYIPFGPGVLGLVIDGRNEGSYGRITSVSQGTHARPKMARVETQENAFETLAAYVLPIGTTSPLVALGT